MDIRSLMTALWRSRWLFAGVTILSAAGAWLFLPDAPYRVTVQASVIVAGDTERPGRAERPELMVLDDLLPLVESPVFAEAVHDSLPSPVGEVITLDDIRDAVSGSRYSRIFSITVTESSPERAKAIGDAVSVAVPPAVVTYLVAPGDTEPTVRIIDPGSAPEQQSSRRWLSIGVIVLFALFAFVSLVWLREAVTMWPATKPNAQVPTAESLAAKKASR